ncbi:MAG TPA: hypothetical protein VJO52_09955 [Gemmatimonadaceae bacterium]|nr:hypothetical protein [Gemmatimonadaceae bacterium]
MIPPPNAATTVRCAKLSAKCVGRMAVSLGDRQIERLALGESSAPDARDWRS